jgi:hypothetical protein
MATNKMSERRSENPTREHVPPIPLGQPHAGHNRSQAAHLNSGPAEPHSKPAGNLLHGPYPGGRKQP